MDIPPPISGSITRKAAIAPDSERSNAKINLQLEFNTIIDESNTSDIELRVIKLANKIKYFNSSSLEASKAMVDEFQKGATISLEHSLSKARDVSQESNERFSKIINISNRLKNNLE